MNAPIMRGVRSTSPEPSLQCVHRRQCRPAIESIERAFDPLSGLINMPQHRSNEEGGASCCQLILARVAAGGGTRSCVLHNLSAVEWGEAEGAGGSRWGVRYQEAVGEKNTASAIIHAKSGGIRSRCWGAHICRLIGMADGCSGAEVCRRPTSREQQEEEEEAQRRSRERRREENNARGGSRPPVTTSVFFRRQFGTQHCIERVASGPSEWGWWAAWLGGGAERISGQTKVRTYTPTHIRPFPF